MRPSRPGTRCPGVCGFNWDEVNDVTTTNTPGMAVKPRRTPRVDPLIAALLIALGALIVIIGSQKPDIFFLPVNLLNIGANWLGIVQVEREAQAVAAQAD